MVFFCIDDVVIGLKDVLIYCYKCKGRKVSFLDYEDNDEKFIGDFNYDYEVNKLKNLFFCFCFIFEFFF